MSHDIHFLCQKLGQQPRGNLILIWRLVFSELNGHFLYQRLDNCFNPFQDYFFMMLGKISDVKSVAPVQLFFSTHLHFLRFRFLKQKCKRSWRMCVNVSGLFEK